MTLWNFNGAHLRAVVTLGDDLAARWRLWWRLPSGRHWHPRHGHRNGDHGTAGLAPALAALGRVAAQEGARETAIEAERAAHALRSWGGAA